jgi:hypothetical protein
VLQADVAAVAVVLLAAVGSAEEVVGVAVEVIAVDSAAEGAARPAAADAVHQVDVAGELLVGVAERVAVDAEAAA